MKIFIGITGASGPVIGLTLIRELLNLGHEIFCSVTDAAARNIEYEVLRREKKFTTVAAFLAETGTIPPDGALKEFRQNDMFSAPASGTALIDAVVLAPCSMKSLSAVANGYADNLITRAADVALKEGRPCVLVPRETPLSLIHLENMTAAKMAGAHILVPAVSYYNHPEKISDVTEFFVGKILNLLKIKHSLFGQWGDDN